jgi:two-component SAPR family response regulator
VAATGSQPEATEALKACLDWVGRTGTEQIIAGDLRADGDLRSLVVSDLGGHPTARRLTERIESMEVLARQYDPGVAERTPKAKVEFRGLGQAVIRSAGGKGEGLQRIARELAFLVLDSGRVERDALLEIFWPEHSPGRQTANLHMAAYQLRQALGKNLLVLEGATYSLGTSASIEYDVRRFERAASLAERLPPGDPRRMFALTEAVASYGGPFLPDSDSLWVVERRRQLQARYLDLLVAAADESMVRNQVSRAATLLREALGHDPLRDDLHRLGRRNEIVELYQRYVRALADSFGLDPPDHLRELYGRLIS